MSAPQATGRKIVPASELSLKLTWVHTRTQPALFNAYIDCAGHRPALEKALEAHEYSPQWDGDLEKRGFTLENLSDMRSLATFFENADVPSEECEKISALNRQLLPPVRRNYKKVPGAAGGPR